MQPCTVTTFIAVIIIIITTIINVTYQVAVTEIRLMQCYQKTVVGQQHPTQNKRTRADVATSISNNMRRQAVNSLGINLVWLSLKLPISRS